MPDSTNDVIELTVVLDAGGVAGMAWTAGLLCGLKFQGCDLSTADTLIGSSLSALLAAQIRSGVALDYLFPMQALSTTPHSWHSVTSENSTRISELWTRLIHGNPSDLLDVLLAARPLLTEEHWRTVIAEHVFMRDWPARELKIIATDCINGEPVAIDQRSGVSFLDAVIASCATPGLVYPTSIEGRYLADGGLCSPKNIAFAKGASKVVVISPMGTAAWAKVNEQSSMQIDQLRRTGSQVIFVTPDYPSRVAFEDNPFLLQTRVHAAEAGLLQGSQLARNMHAFCSR
ncbi:hypothetical protein GTP56_17085 [Duganella sp. FT134W]|uniref:PNPLA domain-containing protein n=1 Tax=Duganella margarita TaxID=2692170 RepID=A0A7X4H371_9BURK|nr:patatin-like phospholipase family protein [Duganella margarita]MYM73906.1 hypothetical protein [Duganella margarita]